MMRRRKLATIAKRWWPSRGGDYDFDRVDRIVRNRHDLVPALIRELVRGAPAGGVRFVGTAIIEDLDFAVNRGERPNSTIDLLLRAGLTKAEIFGVLSGVYVSHLTSIANAERWREVLPDEQVNWLLDDHAPHRWSDNGVTVADGSGMRWVEGVSEWQQVYSVSSSTHL